MKRGVIVHTLLLRLSGPLQSWGSDSLYDNRGTDYYPTKSGVLGMVAAALGIKREIPLSSVSIDGVGCVNLNDIRFGVRIDNPGVSEKDFQITNMGEGLNANLSYRSYLGDATFLVGLTSGDRSLLQHIQGALNHPKYALFLGRKSCPPTLPLDMGIVSDDLYQALYGAEWLVPEWRWQQLFGWRSEIELRIIVEANEGALKKDVPISFEANHRQYGYRCIKDMPGRVIKKKSEYKTKHNPFEELG